MRDRWLNVGWRRDHFIGLVGEDSTHELPIFVAAFRRVKFAKTRAAAPIFDERLVRSLMAPVLWYFHARLQNRVVVPKTVK